MKLDYHELSKVYIDMTEYLKKILDDLPRKYQGEATTPAANYLSEVNETTCKLSEGGAQDFHNIVC